VFNRLPSIAGAEDLLRERGAATIEHPGGTLLDHLGRVRHQLDEWGASLEVQLAGLCHACYGTDGFGVSLLEITERPCLIEVIGSEAEGFVYLYGSCDRAYAYPQLASFPVEFRDRFTDTLTWPDRRAVDAFMEITAANELDVVVHNLAIAVECGPELQELFIRAHGHLTAAAQQAWSDPTLPIGAP